MTGAPTNPLAECFARNLVEARKRAEISQEELACVPPSIARRSASLSEPSG